MASPPRLDQLLQHVDSRYALVNIAAKRARQINNYRHQLGDDSFDAHVPPLVAPSENDLTTAFREIAEGKIDYSYSARSEERYEKARRQEQQSAVLPEQDA
jgi:DNA-directed RNA polymerase subunit omega